MSDMILLKINQNIFDKMLKAGFDVKKYICEDETIIKEQEINELIENLFVKEAFELLKTVDLKNIDKLPAYKFKYLKKK